MKKLIQIVTLSILMFVGINLQAQTQTAAFKQGSIIYSHGTPSNSTFNPETKGIATHSELCLDVDNHILYSWNRTSNTWQKANSGPVMLAVQDSLVNYKEWVGLVAQTSTSAPTITQTMNLGTQNYLGLPVFAYTSTGIYTATLTGLLTANKVDVWVDNPMFMTSATVISSIEWVRTSADVITFTTKDTNITTPAVAVANARFNTVVHIRVWD